MITRTARNISHKDHSKSLWRNLMRGFEVHSQRSRLETLSDRELKDIGITAAQRNLEIQRGFWDFD